MEKNFIETDNFKKVDEKCIQWVKYYDECLVVSEKKKNGKIKNHKICKTISRKSYEKMMDIVFENDEKVRKESYKFIPVKI